jgi:alpha-D-ribose 1-methylphosphonate 5-triphosphate diphosphatase
LDKLMLLKDLRIVLPELVLERGWLRLVGDRIAELGEGEAPAGRAVEGAGLTLIPGMIDLHGDMLERELEPRPGAQFPYPMAVHELDKRLAAAGITVAYAALSFWDNEGRETSRKLEVVRQLVGEIHRQREGLLTDLRVHARFEVSTPVVAPLLGELLEAGQIELLSLMDHTPGQGQYRNIEHYIGFMSKWRRVAPGHVEEELRERLAQAGTLQERWALARDIVAIAAEQGLAIASHDDDTVEKVDLVATLGATLSEFPVTMEAAEEARSRGMLVAMGAPNALRGSSHSGNLSAREAVAAGVVDCLAADYHPGTLVQAAFGLAQAGVAPLHRAVALVTSGPAMVIGMRDAGRIDVGLRADLALVEDGPSPRVRGTIRAGTPIYWDNVMWSRTTA